MHSLYYIDPVFNSNILLSFLAVADYASSVKLLILDSGED